MEFKQEAFRQVKAGRAASVEVSPSDEPLLAHFRAIHEQLRGEYGWPRMHKKLLARGVGVGKERVRLLMQRHGIPAKGKKKFVVTTDGRQHLPVAPDLVQHTLRAGRRHHPPAHR